MKRREYLLLVALTVVAGLVGGAASNRMFMARTATAQEPVKGRNIFEGMSPVTQGAEYHKKVITAEELRIVDRDGNMRAVLGMLPKGGVGLSLHDEDGNGRVSLAFVDGEMGLDFFDEDGELVGVIGILGGKFPGIGLFDDNGTIRVALDLYDGKPQLIFYDKTGRKIIWSAPLSQSVLPSSKPSSFSL